MRRYLLSLIPTAAMLTVVIGACGSGNGGITTPSALPTIAAGNNNWNTIATLPTTLTGAIPEAGVDTGIAGTGIAPYVVQPNDYPIGIMKGYDGCTWDEVAAFNERDPGVLFPDQTINFPPTCVLKGDPAAADPAVPAGATDPATTPAAVPVTPSADGSFPYKIVANDTMFGIATKFDVKMDALMAVNGWSGDPADVNLYPGEDIKIPGAPAG